MAVPTEWRPTTTDIAALLRARTYDGEGDQEGEFTAATRPTPEQVETLIDLAGAELAGRTGTVPEALADMARSVAAFRVAQLVETSYQPEQSEDAGSVADTFGRLYETGSATLVAAVQALGVPPEPELEPEPE